MHSMKTELFSESSQIWTEIPCIAANFLPVKQKKDSVQVE